MQKIMNFLAIGIIFGGFVSNSQAEIYQGDGKTVSSIDELVLKVQPGDVLVIGENHGFKTHQNQQMEIINALKEKYLVSVGMEFLYFPTQNLVDMYLKHQIDESQFLTEIKWGQPSFDYYRDQITSARLELGEQTIALNSPRSLTGKISKNGLGSLTEDEKLLIPPSFQIGRDSYKKRFLEYMGGHLPSAEAGERYFAAQSMWDDTMAWKASEYILNHRNQVFVIVVGEFHVQYGGGLPDRLKARGIKNVWTLSQINIDGLNSEEVESSKTPHPEYGPRANWLWVDVAQP